MVKNEAKLSTSKLIMVRNEKIIDTFFLFQIGWISQKAFHATVTFTELGKFFFVLQYLIQRNLNVS
jgi:hypothetical protein